MAQHPGSRLRWFAPRDDPGRLVHHLVIVGFHLLMLVGALILTLTTISSLIAGNDRQSALLSFTATILFVDCFIISLLAGSRLICYHLGFTIDPDTDDLLIYAVGFWYRVPNESLRHAHIVITYHTSSYHPIRRRRMIVVQVPGVALSVYNRIAGLMAELRYHVSSLPCFYITVTTKNHQEVIDKIISVIEPDEPEGDQC